MANKTKLLIATSNQGKLKEFSLLLPDFKIISQKSLNLAPEEETGTTFYENSLHKAKVGATKSGLLSLGDDSGLIVPALGNMPGLHSARYAHENATDEENRNYLKNELKKIGVNKTKAYFVCILTIIKNAEDPFPLISTGILDGIVSIESRGQNGFGYDEMFYPKNYKESLAEMSLERKSEISHRGKAIRDLKNKIDKFSK